MATEPYPLLLEGGPCSGWVVAEDRGATLRIYWGSGRQCWYDIAKPDFRHVISRAPSLTPTHPSPIGSRFD